MLVLHLANSSSSLSQADVGSTTPPDGEFSTFTGLDLASKTFGVNAEGETALAMVAAASRWSSAVRLAEAGADPDARLAGASDSALSRAAAEGEVGVVEVFLSLRSPRGLADGSALRAAAVAGHARVLEVGSARVGEA